MENFQGTFSVKLDATIVPDKSQHIDIQVTISFVINLNSKETAAAECSLL